MPHPSHRPTIAALAVVLALLAGAATSSAAPRRPVDPRTLGDVAPVLVTPDGPLDTGTDQVVAATVSGVALAQARVAVRRMVAARHQRHQRLLHVLRTRFSAGHVYAGTFADPSVLRVGHTYVAYGTTTGHDNLPVMTSPDLHRWKPRPSLSARHRTGTGPNDSLPRKPRWAVRRPGGVRNRISLWAPSAARVRGHYVVAYAAAVRLSPHKACIGIATGRSAMGPFRDRHRRPLVCYPPSVFGAIDPDVFVDPRTHTPYLLWKNEGIPHVHPSRLLARRLDPSGSGFARGSHPLRLLQTARRWEGRVVENPAMVRYAGHYFLFYSGNHWFSRTYAVGYARCAGPLGPCVRASRGPLIASGHGMVGPGGADPFVDDQGRLRLAYAAWDAGTSGRGRGNLRRMHVAILRVGHHGGLRVRRLY